MIRLAAAAQQQISELLEHYTGRGRPEAGRNLITAIDKAIARLSRDPECGLPAPRPYPILARPGRAWIKSGRYWIAYSTTVPPLILAIFHETADIPRRDAAR